MCQSNGVWKTDASAAQYTLYSTKINISFISMQGIEELQRKGLVKAIGVSNFSRKQSVFYRQPRFLQH